MGGGAARGFAHVGAWKAIQEAEIAVAGIIGTSTGAIIGAAVAGGRTVEEMEEHSHGFRRRDIMRANRRAPWVDRIRSPSVFRGDILRRFILDLLPTEDWRDLTIPLIVNAVDLSTGETVWLGHGSDQDVALVDSVHASAALPVLFPPVEVGGRLLIDGGALDMLPLGRAAEMGATRIIAIDVGAGRQADARVVLGWRPNRRSTEGFLHHGWPEEKGGRTELDRGSNSPTCVRTLKAPTGSTSKTDTSSSRKDIGRLVRR